jgi:hypothetical protein
MDDLIITGDNTKMIDFFIDFFAHRFSIKDLGQLSYFLSMEVVPNQQSILLFQRRNFFGYSGLNSYEWCQTHVNFHST